MDGNEEREILHRLDEKTESIKESVDRIDSTLNEQAEQIEENKILSQRNKTKIALGAYASGVLFTAFVAKVAGVSL